jgi:predicted nucleic acid-binding protein
VIYLDSSALLKLLHEEPESAALAEWLSSHADNPMVSSEVAKVEVLRACRRINPDVLPAARSLLAQLDLIPLTSDLIDDAADVGAVTLRSLDAIHLASALSIRSDVASFIAYDLRLGDAAVEAGLEPLRPGPAL